MIVGIKEDNSSFVDIIGRINVHQSNVKNNFYRIPIINNKVGFKQTVELTNSSRKYIELKIVTIKFRHRIIKVLVGSIREIEYLLTIGRVRKITFYKKLTGFIKG